VRVCRKQVLTALIPTNCCINMRPTPTTVRFQHPWRKQSSQDATSSLNPLARLPSCRVGCLSRLTSCVKATSARISHHSLCTRESVVGRPLSLARTWSASSSRPLLDSQRGEKGRKMIPLASMKPGIIWRRKGSRHDHSPAM
jgi:hypothetical protein